MKRFGLTALALVVVTGWGCDDGGQTTEPDAQHEDAQDGAAVTVTVPSEYATLTNPMGWDADTEVAGAALYADHCASCHGGTGAGDGASAAGLDPQPASFRALAFHEARSDGHLMWRVSDGVEGTAMAGFEELSVDDRWRLLAHLRTLSDVSLARSAANKSGALTVSYFPVVGLMGDPSDAVPRDKTIALAIQVAPTLEGIAMPGDLQIAAEVWMPEHDHGLDTEPTWTSDAFGELDGAGVTFSMAGHWELRVDLTTSGKTDRVTFNILVY